MSDEQQWGTSPQGEDEAAKRQAEREKEFERKLDKELEKHLGVPPRTTENKGVRLDKSDVTRQLYTSHQPYDSQARREAITQHLERMGVSKELQQIRDILERGHAAPPGVTVERRDPRSPGAPMRGRGGRGGPEQGMGRERD